MSFYNLVRKSIFYHGRINIAVLLGAAISTMILTGGLIVGDSVKYSLNQQVALRLGEVRYTLDGGDRFFRSQLANDLSKDLNVKTSAVLQMQAIGIKGGGQLRANNLVVNGIDNSFEKLVSFGISMDSLKEDEICINYRVAQKLNLQEGDDLLLKVEKQSLLPKNTPFVAAEQPTVSFRLTVKKILPDDKGGRFSLKSNQVAPLNLFIKKAVLAKKLDLPEMANLILLGKGNGELRENDILKTLNQCLSLEDINLEWRDVEATNEVELVSHRVFFDEAIVSSTQKAIPESNPIITYFVNSISNAQKSIPYSFVSAPGFPFVSDSLKDNQIIINEWAAKELGIVSGAELSLSYFTVGPMRKLSMDSAQFKVHSVVNLEGIYADKNLMPILPGLSDAGSCRDWETGVPVDLDKIKQKDEEYWNDHKGTPKVFVTKNSAKKLWSNRFGTYTAIRFPSSINKNETFKKIAKELDPTLVGFQFTEVWSNGKKAADNSIDFGQLFISLSFFILVSGLLLTALLYALSIEMRTVQTGTLLSLGYQRKHLQKLLLTEGLLVSLAGSIVGSFLGILYNKLVFIALDAVWNDIVRTTSLFVLIKPSTLIIGAVSGTILALITMYFTLRKKMTKTLISLQRKQERKTNDSGRSAKISRYVFFISVIATLGILASLGIRVGENNTSLFFIGSAFLFSIGISLTNLHIYKKHKKAIAKSFSMLSLATRNISRRKSTSLTTVLLISIGTFLVISTGANRTDIMANGRERSSGTGGFSYWAELSMPILSDLNTKTSRYEFGLDAERVKSLEYIQMHVLDGDDASCLNLNMVQQPRILGIKPELFIEKDAFDFATRIDELKGKNPWEYISNVPFGPTIPAIADQTVIQWGLGKKVGDTLFYQSENGERLNVVLVAGLKASIFQGNILIADHFFTKHFPSVSGSKLMLVDSPEQMDSLQTQILQRNLSDYGIELQHTGQRLTEFMSITNTYLTIFFALGGLGLILGTIGLGIVVFRNTMERRNEFALLQAVGYRRVSILKLILQENISLLVAGLLTGTVASIFAVLPSLMTPGTGVPYQLIWQITLGILINGVVWIVLSGAISLKGNLIDSLRRE